VEEIVPRGNHSSKVLMVSTVVLAIIPAYAMSTLAQSSKPMRRIAMVVKCDPARDQAPERIFANAGLKSWQEYATVEAVPPLSRDDHEQMFVVSLNSSGQKHVYLVEYNEDASISHTYCYDKAGTLRTLSYEIRTDWGWGYSEERVLGSTGGILRRNKRFFDTESNETIPRPRQADDVPDFLKPEVYSSFNTLPFIAIFNKSRIDATP
jgi:hypothetical protein